MTDAIRLHGRDTIEVPWSANARVIIDGELHHPDAD
jgi:hypothetical protein